MRKFEIIKEPIITERSMQLVETNNSYTFVVDKKLIRLKLKKQSSKSLMYMLSQ